MSQRCMRLDTVEYDIVYSWPLTPPDLLSRDFCLCSCVKDEVFVPTSPKDLPQLEHRITEVVTPITRDKLVNVLEKMG